MSAYIMLGLPMQLMQELNVGIVRLAGLLTREHSTGQARPLARKDYI